ncbi:MAG: LCP family protein [Lachnospiraceae bacterium]|nr:LCP family protein [Lachnospiraceae bacterium]
MDNENKEMAENTEMSINEGTGKKNGFFKRMSLPKKIIFIIVVILLIAALALGITFLVIQNMGRAALKESAKAYSSDESYKTVEYNGKTYTYNENLINILAMGIDNKHTISYIREHVNDEKRQLRWNGGQADALFLITIDPDNKKISVMPINRLAMTNIQFYDPAEEAYFTDEGQICTQHGYSTGLEDGCELQVKATSEMLNYLPINGYVSINLPAISELNHVVGGVEVEVLEDIPPKAHKNYDYGIGDSLTGVVGQKITLNDNQAYAYIRYREMTNVNSNENRVKRQKQYIKALVKKVKEMTKKDIFFPKKMMDALSDYMITDIDSTELLYLGTTIIGYDIDMDNTEGLPGEKIEASKYTNGDVTLGFRIDRTRLQELLIKKYYKEKS